MADTNIHSADGLFHPVAGFPYPDKATAVATGAQYYAGTRPCAQGHNPAIRYTASGHCIECRRDQYVKWHNQNPGKQAAYNRKWYGLNLSHVRAVAGAYREANRDKVRELQTSWTQKNPEQARARYKRYAQNNPEKVATKDENRRARKKAALGTFTAADIQEIRQQQRNRCAYCRKSLKAGFHIDHIMPLALGGSNDRRNLQLLCEPCNLRKGAKHPVEFAQRTGLLL